MKKIEIPTVYKPDISNEYYCIHSIQNLNSEHDTNVFASNIPIDQLLKNRDILLVDDLRGDARWGMNKIIQRNISKERVKEIRKEYLEASNRSIKFFPAITVVLLPKTLGEPKQYFEQASEGFDNVKGIEVEKTYESDHFVMNFPISIRWDKNDISALVIDGQHRVSAIREYYDGKNEALYKDVSIPVSFVVFKNNHEIDLIQATRALFIDVNNTPRLVSEEKLIFIDDRNIQRRITSRALGANDPGDNNEDVYQKMLGEEDFLIPNNQFINRYLVEESGKDDEDKRGYISNHKSLFPWEISNIMTIHKNILGSILLKYKDVDKTRDIRSICFQLNSSILDEIESMVAVDELSETKEIAILDRLRSGGLSENELEIFKKLIFLKKRHLEEIQQSQVVFLTGVVATEEEENDRNEYASLLRNVYNQNCSKDPAFELRGTTVSDLLNENCSEYVNMLVKVYNGLWLTKQIKKSILEYSGEDLKLIFNFLVTTHESLRIEGNIRLQANKVERQITNFFNEYDNPSSERVTLIKEWARKLEELQSPYVLRKIVGQEMLFMFIISQNDVLSSIDLEETLIFINSLGEIGFFNSSKRIELEFFLEPDFSIDEFNPWSEIIMKGESMKPGITNAKKGSDLISFVKNNFTNRATASSRLQDLNRLQKSYGVAVLHKIANEDLDILYRMYSKAKDSDNLDQYLTSGEIATISEDFENGQSITGKATGVISKLYGAIALEQVVTFFNRQIE